MYYESGLVGYLSYEYNPEKCPSKNHDNSQNVSMRILCFSCGNLPQNSFIPPVSFLVTSHLAIQLGAQHHNHHWAMLG
jgi:hypothetical protein